MDRRFLTVLGVSLMFALVVSGIFYQMASRRPDSSPKVEQAPVKDVVVAARPLAVGSTIKPDDVKIVKTSGEPPKGSFSKVEELLDRPVVSNILQEEPILEGRLAARGSGMGMAPIIPVGMRAVSVKVNEVVGVAGFVLPGMRVDVLVTGRPPDTADTITTTVLQNILVLSAGQTMQPEANGQAINAPTVTLLVSPEQAEILTLAGSEGRIQLVLRNANDQTIATTPGREISELYGRRKPPAPRADSESAPRPRPVQVVQAAPPPPPPPPPPDQIVVIRGTQKSVEVVSTFSGDKAREIQ